MDNAPYMRLIASVLGLAVKDARSYLKKHKLSSYPTPSTVVLREAATAFAWILDDSHRGGGFRWACSALDFDPDFVRATILRPRMADKKLLDRLNEFGCDDE
jgi:hypothetical protein